MYYFIRYTSNDTGREGKSIYIRHCRALDIIFAVTCVYTYDVARINELPVVCQPLTLNFEATFLYVRSSENDAYLNCKLSSVGGPDDS